jgi:diacylglycerol kinase (ATP)
VIVPEVQATDVAHEAPVASAKTQIAAVVYNPIKVEIEALKAAMAADEATADWEVMWLETSEEDPGQGQAREAIEAGATVVLAAGGDGTVRAVAEIVKDSDASLALLPSGTGNLLARNLSLTLDDLPNAIHTAFAGKDRPIDVAVADIRREDNSVDRHAYLVMAGFGLDAKMLANTDPELKKKAGWLAYAKAIVATLRDKNVLRFRYTLDDERARSIRAHTIIIGNCGSLPANIMLLPDAAVDDGEFDILILRPESIRGWVQILTKIFWENGVVKRTKLGRKLQTKEIDALNYKRGTKLTMRLDDPDEIELDGDGFGVAIGLRTWIEAGALAVRVPQDS